jgi:hypothetical protein
MFEKRMALKNGLSASFMHLESKRGLLESISGSKESIFPIVKSIGNHLEIPLVISLNKRSLGKQSRRNM